MSKRDEDVFLPLGQASNSLTLPMEIEFDSEDGVTGSTLEQKVKETIRQIGATIVEETAE